MNYLTNPYTFPGGKMFFLPGIERLRGGKFKEVVRVYLPRRLEEVLNDSR